MKKIVFFFVLLALLVPSTISVKADKWVETITFSTGTVVDLSVTVGSSTLTDSYHHGIDIAIQLKVQAYDASGYQNTTVEYKLNNRFSSSVTFPTIGFIELSNYSSFRYFESWGHVNLSMHLFSIEQMHHDDDHYISSGWIVFFTISPPYRPDTGGVSSFNFVIIGVALIGIVVVRKQIRRRRKSC